MMTTNLPSGVVVGVDGSAASDTAVRYGALEASRLDTDLTLIHVVPDYGPLVPMPPTIPDDLIGVGRNLVVEARELAARYAEDVAATTLVRTGAATAALVAVAKDARLMVLGRHLKSHLHHIFTGTVTSGGRGRTARWYRCRTTGTRRRPRAACWWASRTPRMGATLWPKAFASASARGARLTVIHAWKLPSVYDDIIVRRTHDEDWNVRALDSFESRIAELREEYPGVRVDVKIAHAQPAHALIVVAAGADLLIIERRDGRLPAILPPHGAPIKLDHLEPESAGAPLT